MPLRLLKIALIASVLASGPARAACERSDRVVIAPPPVDDWMLATWLAEQATRELFRRQKDRRCLSVKTLAESAPAFDMVGSMSSFPRAIDAYGPRQIAFVAQRLDATHVLFLDAPTSEGRLRSQLFAVRDKTKLVPERTFSQALDPKALDAHRSDAFARFMTKIAPNAVEAGTSRTDVFFDVNPGFGRHETTLHGGSFPPILSSFAVTRIEHRRGFDLFDWSGSLFPGTYFFGINQDDVYTKRPESGDAALPDRLALHIETYGACGTWNAEGSLFSPIGTTYFGIGWGPCALWLRTQDRAANWYAKTATRLFFGHRVFISDRIFVDVDADSLMFNQSLYHAKYAKASQVERSGISIGWYIANSEPLASRVLNWLF